METSLQHIAFIMDGNGRWAERRGLARTEGHKEGAKRVFDVAKRAFEHWHIPYVTLYAFSTENWKRPAYEISIIFKLLTTYLKNKRSVFLENKIRFNTIGDVMALPKEAQIAMQTLKDETADFKDYTLTIALNYGAREEVLRAVKKLASQDLSQLSWERFASYFYTADMPDPDLIVRTSGEQRLSNYLLLQAAYSELYFTPTYWPDFTEVELDRAVEDFLKRTRRFGNI